MKSIQKGQILIVLFLCAFNNIKVIAENTETKNDENTQNLLKNDFNQHQQPLTYAAAFPYKSSPTHLKLNNNLNEEDVQRTKSVAENFSNNDKSENDKGLQNNGNKNDEPTERPKHVIRFTEEQLNLPNPYLINSNVPKDDDEYPCLPYDSIKYPCPITNLNAEKRNTDTFNTRSPTSKDESNLYQQNNEKKDPLHIQIPTEYPQFESVNRVYSLLNNEHQQQPSISTYLEPPIQSQYNGQNPNIHRKFESADVTVVCNGLECATKIRTSNDNEPTKTATFFTKSNEIFPSIQQQHQQHQQQQDFDFNSGLLQNYQSKILNAIIRDLQYFHSNPFNFDNMNNFGDQQQQQSIIGVVADEYKNDNKYFPSNHFSQNPNFKTQAQAQTQIYV